MSSGSAPDFVRSRRVAGFGAKEPSLFSKRKPGHTLINNLAPSLHTCIPTALCKVITKLYGFNALKLRYAVSHERQQRREWLNHRGGAHLSHALIAVSCSHCCLIAVTVKVWCQLEALLVITCLAVRGARAVRPIGWLAPGRSLSIRPKGPTGRLDVHHPLLLHLVAEWLAL